MRAARRDGHDVICLDNFFTSQKTNVAHLLDRPNFDLIRHDVTQPIFLEVDEIYNLACPAAPGHYQFNPIKTMKTSVMGAINVLGMANRCRAKVLQASTSEVYGDPTEHPQRETYRGNVNPIGPRACYDEGKRAAETLFMDYHRMNRINIRIVRIFNTYGPRMHPFDGRVVSNFIRQALAGEDITLFGDGQQTRSFCYRDDLVEGLIRHDERPRRFHRPVQPRQPRRVHRQAAGRAGHRADRLEIENHPSAAAGRRSRPAGSPTSRSPSKHLGWEPTTPLRDGLQENDRLVPHDQAQRLPAADAELLIWDFVISDLRICDEQSHVRRSQIPNPKSQIPAPRHKPPPRLVPAARARPLPRADAEQRQPLQHRPHRRLLRRHAAHRLRQPKDRQTIARDGADQVQIEVHRTLPPVLKELKAEGYTLVGLEQTTNSVSLHEYQFPRRTALVIGNERLGLTDEELQLVDAVVEIPVWGLPYAYNVANATAMALYEYCRQFPAGYRRLIRLAIGRPRKNAPARNRRGVR